MFIKESARELNQAIELPLRDQSNDPKSKLSEKCGVTVMKFNNGVEYLHASSSKFHNNTTKTISKTAKSSLPMVTVYHLKSSTPNDV